MADVVDAEDQLPDPFPPPNSAGTAMEDHQKIDLWMAIEVEYDVVSEAIPYNFEPNSNSNDAVLLIF